MDNSDGSQSDRGEPIVKRARGSTKMEALVARYQEQRERLHVDFDANMNPIGAEEDRFISYLGYLARSKVRIVYSNWKLVPQKTKEMIWQQILQTYNVPDNKAMNKHWMGEVRLLWKDFKNKLTQKYIRGAKRDEDPCQRYSYISPEDWRLFVASRQDPQFLKVSEANKKRQAGNKYQHYMSRGGYRKLERRMMEEELEKMKEVAKLDSGIIVQAPDPPPRHKKWKFGRLKGDKYINPVVAEVAIKIDELEEKRSQGSFTPSGRMDILSTAIGKADHLSHVRGEPGRVGVATYFGRASRYSSQGEHNRELVAEIREEVSQSLLEEVRQSLREEVRRELEVQLRESLRQELLKELHGEARSIIQSERENEERRTQDSPTFPSAKRSYNLPECTQDI
ncbi:hypothetical protein QN277_026502 [Acacia crassicarpa]|uniref:Transposase, Ptta/En/Spm, plant n=1 Tax=Acacia crassicarpa TaxID=499986 RepID=A0AAE1MHV2_9FABA|nr:hypothetical protein QN277_026502 [Acacia crassicarpa]